MNDGWLVAYIIFFMPIGSAMFLYAGLLQLLRHREKMLYVSKDLIPADAASVTKGSDPLRWAVVLLFAGLGIALGIWPAGMTNPLYPLGLTPWMLLGALPVCIALGLLTVHAMNRRDRRGGG
ncbi:MAG: hypothetical protein JW929_00440 [Anaerolineales bacterium]|nr:hypothetical protein [Anaerolineales bacterium]